MKVFANCIFDKELISKYIRNSYNSIANKQNAILKWEKKLNRHFCKEYI